MILKVGVRIIQGWRFCHLKIFPFFAYKIFISGPILKIKKRTETVENNTDIYSIKLEFQKKIFLKIKAEISIFRSNFVKLNLSLLVVILNSNSKKILFFLIISLILCPIIIEYHHSRGCPFFSAFWIILNFENWTRNKHFGNYFVKVCLESFSCK